MSGSERRKRGIRILARGDALPSLPAASPPFLRVLYEGGKPWPREDFDWSVALQGLIAPGKLSEAPGDQGVTEGYK